MNDDSMSSSPRYIILLWWGSTVILSNGKRINIVVVNYKKSKYDHSVCISI